MKRLLPYFSGFLLIMSSFSCNVRKEHDNREEPEKLFTKTIEFLSESISKIEEMNDSNDVSNLIENVDKGLTAINFSVPPATDYKLSEQENDSIIKLMESFKLKVKQRYQQLSRKETSEADSI
ncbi:MAG: hypothetical protein J1E95_00940 [Muribaculaceae bacterium]|nr:hypothetical protein [Muribaculaceae bacterium]